VRAQRVLQCSDEIRIHGADALAARNDAALRIDKYERGRMVDVAAGQRAIACCDDAGSRAQRLDP
jgi:hypothetical protein